MLRTAAVARFVSSFSCTTVTVVSTPPTTTILATVHCKSWAVAGGGMRRSQRPRRQDAGYLSCMRAGPWQLARGCTDYSRVLQHRPKSPSRKVSM